MATTSNLILDNWKKVVYCFTNQDVDETTAALKIDASTLVGHQVTVTLTTTPAVGSQFQPGDYITSNGDGIGYVVVHSGTKLTISVVSGSFDTTDVITGPKGNSFTQTGAFVASTYDLNIAKIKWSVSSGEDVSILFDGATDGLGLVLNGNGSWDLNNWSGAIPNNATTPTGDINIQTGTTFATSEYTIILECHKVAGYGGV